MVQVLPQLSALSQNPRVLDPAELSQKQFDEQPPVPPVLKGGPVQVWYALWWQVLIW